MLADWCTPNVRLQKSEELLLEAMAYDPLKAGATRTKRDALLLLRKSKDLIKMPLLVGGMDFSQLAYPYLVQLQCIHAIQSCMYVWGSKRKIVVVVVVDV